MSKITDRRQVKRIALLFTVVYMVSYITRINYEAVVESMKLATGTSKELLSLAVMGSFITYGGGQIISGICSDKFPPKLLIIGGFAVTSLMNLCIPLCGGNPYAMAAVWSVNGFAQAFMWPPLIRILTHLLSSEDYSNAIVNVNGGSCYGTIVVYIAASLLVMLSWKAVFVFSAICGIIMLILLSKLCPDVKPEKKGNTEEMGGDKKLGNKLLFAPLMLVILLSIIMMGAIRDGIHTWMPSYINETYNLGESISILSSAVLPLFALGCMKVAALLHSKKFTNPVLCAGVIFAAAAISAFVLVFSTGKNAVVSIIFMAVLYGAMYGVNLMLIAMVPAAFKKYGNVSTASGVINSCTYVGSAISAYGIARVLGGGNNWQPAVLIWCALAVGGTLICLLCAKKWGKTHM